MKQSNVNSRSGVSLVEMTIVITIIALVITAVLVGQNMVGVSKGNKAISDLQNYKTVYDQFKNKYESLPGDMNDATYYWSTSANGNGNWQIEGDDEDEIFLVWQHFNLAGFITANYSGHKTTPTGQVIALGTDAPMAPYKDSGYAFVMENFDGTTVTLTMGDPRGGKDGSMPFGAIDSREATLIDSKIDDGKASTGILRGRNDAGGAAACIAAGNYNVSNGQNKDCLIFYLVEGAK